MNFKTKLMIANEYGIDRKTLYRKLKKFKITIARGLVTPKDQERIYNCLGYPNGVEEKDYEHLSNEKSG